MNEEGFTLEFVRPTAQREKEIAAFAQSFYDAGETVINGSGGLDFYDTQAEWLAALHRIETGEDEGFLPSHVYLAQQKESKKIVGIVDIRPTLPPEKYDWGHIGYAVAPGCRRKGFATQIARWAAAKLREAGAQNVFACCYEENTASLAVLAKAGFVPTGSYIYEGDGKTVLICTLQ